MSGRSAKAIRIAARLALDCVQARRTESLEGWAQVEAGMDPYDLARGWYSAVRDRAIGYPRGVRLPATGQTRRALRRVGMQIRRVSEARLPVIRGGEQ